MNREVLFYHGFEIGLREEYAIEYLETALETYREACGLRLETFTKGRGHKKTAEQKDYEQLQEYIARLKKYAEHLEVCGESRNSYSKT